MADLWSNWRLEFMAAHPTLFRIAADQPQLSFGYPLCQVGWRAIIDRVQTSLDPQVRSLEFIPTAPVDAAQVDLQAIVVVRDDGRFHLDVVEARRVGELEIEGLALIALDRLGVTPLTLTAADIRREPRFANSKSVWAYRMHPLGIEMRMRVLSTLQDDGPLQLGCLPQLVRSVQDPAPAVMALACSDLIEIDLASQPLGPVTIVRART